MNHIEQLKEKAREEFDRQFIEIVNPLRANAGLYKHPRHEEIKSFIDTLIDRTVLEERERFIEKIYEIEIYEDQSPHYIRDEIVDLIKHTNE